VTVFKTILLWELKTGLRRVSTWVYFTIGFTLSFFPMLALGGAWDLGVGATGPTIPNSPHALSGLIPGIALILMSITAAIAGNALYRDYDAGIEQLLYTTPVKKSEFLGGRFAGAIAVNLVVLAGIGLGTALAAASPFVKPDKMAAFELAAYVGPYLTYVIPNLLLTAAIFFALVSMTRQMMPIYVGGVLLLIAYLIAGTLLADLDNKRLAALLDPFGMRAHDVVTEYWSVAEKNTLHVPVEGVILANRLIWLAVGFAIFAFAYRRFRFAYDVDDAATIQPVQPSGAALEPEMFLARVQPAELPAVTRRFDWRARWTQFASVVTRSFWRIVRNRYFAVIVGAGLLFLGFTAKQAGRLFGTPTWPVTYHMEEILLGTIGAFIIIVIAVYSGELVWAERDVKVHQIVDATTVPSWVLFLGKLTALCAMIALLLVVMMLAGIVTQALKGYYHFEIGLYLQSLFGIYFVDMVLLAALAMALHVLVNHKYVGHLVVILTLVGAGLLPLLGLDRGFYQYGYDSGTTYSDMNGWGPFITPFVWWKAYWLAFCALLAVGTTLFWVRGEETRLAWRARLARRRFTRPARLAAATAGLAFAGVGGFLFYNTDFVNIHRTAKEERRLSAQREKRYKKYEKVPQPRVTAVKVRVDLMPRGQDMVITGHYVLRNKTSATIDTVHVGLSELIGIRRMTFDGGGQHILADSLRDYHMFRLPRPLGPGDSTVMQFELAHETRGIPNRVQNTFIVENGTFVSSMFLPTIGYSADAELGGDDARAKEGLRPKDRMRPPTDSAALMRNDITQDADWIDFDLTVSTDEDQTAIGPGYLQREWVENGRRVFHYTMDVPILKFWAVLSGRYAVKRDRWRNSRDSAQAVDITILHHPTHTYNLDRMVAGAKKALDYLTVQFGPYQHRQVRIVEFPRYASFAQSLPNLIPYSEAIGFIARVEKPEDVDYPFYVTAHEVAHAWWGHQVVGADAQGASMLSETLASYSGLMVMEKEFGAKNMRRFLAYELDNYLSGRGSESRREMPLQLVENQAYIHYHKGALVMYALRDHIGGERVNHVLRTFLERWRFKGPPYPTSLELVRDLRAATPDSLEYLIEDLFETITLHELRADSAVATDAPGQPGRFQVDLWVHAKKVRADSLGREREIAMRDWIDVGVYAKVPRGAESPDKNGVPLRLAKQRVDSGSHRFTVVVDQRPYRAGIDPLHKLIDRKSEDNTVGVRDRTSAPARRDTTRRDTLLKRD
jgi:ABC-2 type transport system permease protein